MFRRLLVPGAILLSALAALGLAACGGSSSGSSSSAADTTSSASSTSTGGDGSTTSPSGGSSTSGAGATLNLTADPSGALKFDTTKLTAKAGAITLKLANPASSGVPHAIAVEGSGVDQDGPTVQPGGTSSVTVTLKPGTYTFYCPVPGHKDAGMKGTLTVT